MEGKQAALDLFDENQAYIKGKLLYEIFHNAENLFSIIRIRVQETTENVSEKEMVVVGNLPPLAEEEVYTFWGQLVEHPRFGLQYKVKQFRKEMPQGKDGVIQYLSSNLFPGIGKKIASNIVEELGEDAILRIMEDPQLLANVPHFPQGKQQQLYQRLMEYQGLEQIMIKLSQYGIGLALSVQIYQAYEDEAMQIIQNNPYQLIEDVEGIGFRRADIIGKAMGLKYDSPERIRAACIYFLREQSEKNGHVYYPLPELLSGVTEWLNKEENNELSEEFIPEEIIKQQALEMCEEQKLMLDEERIYLPSLFFAEKGFARKLKKLVQKEINLSYSQDEYYKALGHLEERLGIEYAPSQREAIETALRSSIMILTGGPGTGKTTVIKGVCEMFAELHGFSLDPKEYTKKEEDFPLILIAPTGRAAKRMTESTGIPAVTIHRLLGWRGGREFERSEDDPISGKLLIVDETSMMDQWLANQLFRAITEDIQVVLVGDQDQLPSVGPGQVLKDLIDCDKIPMVELKDIYRQSEGSSIISLAHQMKKGELPQDLMESKDDRRFFPCHSADVVHIVKQVYSSAIRKGYTVKDIQVLAPMYRGEAGIDALNNSLQELLNPKAENKRELSIGEVTFRSGDKVLQLVNNPEQHVFNGDIGEVDSIIYAKENTDKEDLLVVSFDSNEVTYKRSDLNQLTLAYCCSVHKSQGSEFPIVIFPVVKAYYRMLKKNLVYTAITRGKDYLILCGEEDALHQAVKQNEILHRYTSLRETLQDWIN